MASYKPRSRGRADHLLNVNEHVVRHERSVPAYLSTHDRSNERGTHRAASLASSKHPSKLQWPPPPTVENEASSLAREKSPPPAHHPSHDAILRGTVDQVPIMEDLRSDDLAENQHYDSENSSLSEHSSEGTPLTSNSHNEERRYIWLPNEKKPLSRPESHTRHAATMSSTGKLDTGGMTPAANLRVNSDMRPRSNSYERSPRYAPLDSNHDFVASPTTFKTAHGGLVPPNLAQRPPGARTSSAQNIPTGGVRPSLARSSSDYASMPSELGHGPRGRDSTPRSRRESFGSTTSDSSSYQSSPPRSKRSSQYSFTASDLKNNDKNLGEKRNSIGSRRSTVEKGQPITPEPSSAWHNVWQGDQQPNFSSNTPNKSFFPENSSNRPPPAKIFPRPSPLQTPYATPPPSPGREYTGFNWHKPSSPARHSRNNSRPTTPSLLSPPHTAGYVTADDGHLRPPSGSISGSNGSSSPQRPGSVISQGQPQMVEIRRDSSNRTFAPRSRQTSPLPVASGTGPSSHDQGLPSSNIPHSAPPSKQIFPHDVNSRPVSRDGPLSPQPRNGPVPTFLNPRQTSVSGLSKPELPERPRKSVELPRPQNDGVQTGTRSRSAAPRELPVLPACPRPTFVEGYTDWSTLPGHPNFDICPSCRRGLEEAGSAARFIPSPNRPERYSTRCDLSISWVRMAWLLLLQSRPTHPTVIDQITTTLSREPVCPGKELAARNWYRLYDAENAKYVSNFDVCQTCTRLMEALFPNMKGVLLRTSTDASLKRTCDLRADSRRFVRYVDLLDEISNQAYSYQREPRMHRFVKLAKQLTAIQECREDDQLIDQPWHFMPQLPDFTVCEECYKDEVRPLAKQGLDLATRFTRKPDYPPQTPVPVSCQLYSPRMREIWKRTCTKGDFENLRTAVVQRVAKERELQTRHSQLYRWPEAQRLEEGAKLVSEWRRWA